MKNFLFILALSLLIASPVFATSTIDFMGNDYSVSVIISDDNCEIVNVWVLNEDIAIITPQNSENDIFEKAECNCVKNKIHIIIPVTAEHQRFELTAGPKKGLMSYGNKKIKLKSNWDR